jgi:hypothetical protein
LSEPDDAVLVGNVTVLDRGQQLIARNQGDGGEHGIVGFAPAQQEDKKRQDGHKE